MKRILLAFALAFGILSAEESTSSSDIGQWRTFVGIEGGVGLYSIFPSAFFNFNNYLVGEKPYADSLGYSLALSVGWQKYYSETFGKRFILSLRGDYMQDYGSYDDREGTTFSLGNGYGFMFSFITDWLFDFSVNGNKRYGMFAGIGVDIAGGNVIKIQTKRVSSEERGTASIGLSIVARIGFKAQIENNIFDIALNIPTLGLMSVANLDGNKTNFLHAPINSTLTLGYKYLF